MEKKKDIREKKGQSIKASGSGKEKAEMFHFGEASVRVDSVGVNAWQCSVGGTIIGFVTYTPEYRFRNEGRGRDYGYQGYHSSTLKEAELYPATDVNRYSSLRNAVRAVTARHFSGRTYTYVHDNVVVLDGKVVPKSVLKGRKVIKPVLS